PIVADDGESNCVHSTRRPPRRHFHKRLCYQNKSVLSLDTSHSLSSSKGRRQTKFAASSMLPLPIYRASLGYAQSGRVRSTTFPVLCEAMIRSGATPCSTQFSKGASISKSFGPGPPAQWCTPGTMKSLENCSVSSPRVSTMSRKYRTVRTGVITGSAHPFHMRSLPPFALNRDKSGSVAFRKSPVGTTRAMSVSKLNVKVSKSGPNTKYRRYASAVAKSTDGVVPLPVTHRGHPSAPSSWPCGSPG